MLQKLMEWLQRWTILIRIFGLKLAYLIISAAEQVSINIQAKDITVQEAVRGAQLFTTHLSSMRNEAKFIVN